MAFIRTNSAFWNGYFDGDRGTLPLALFGAAWLGARRALLVMPAGVAQAAAPLPFGLCPDGWGKGVLWICAALALNATVL